LRTPKDGKIYESHSDLPTSSPVRH